MGEIVLVDKETWEEMLGDSILLNALLSMGVDNWEGYDAAIDMYREEKAKQLPEVE